MTRPAFTKVWDPLIRVFHWSLVSFFAIAWITAYVWDGVHDDAGYVVAGLIGFRIVWGLVGPQHARFSDFVYRPSVVIGHLKDSLFLRARRYLGHNPAGGAMTVALLLCLGVISVTGVMLTTETYWTLEWVEELHETSAYLSLGLVFVHVAGVIFSSLEHKENLVWSMISGKKRADS